MQVWDAATGKVFYTYRGHSAGVMTVGWSPDGKRIASGSQDKTAQVWDAATGEVFYTYRGYNVELARVSPDRGVLPSTIYIVAWSHNGKRIAAVGDEYCGDECGTMVFWDATSGHNISFYLDQQVFALAWSPDDTRVVTAVGSSSVEIHSAR